jgi:hypothetical protein
MPNIQINTQTITQITVVDAEPVRHTELSWFQIRRCFASVP